MKTAIRYGINRKVKGVSKKRSTIEHRNGTAEIAGAFDDPEFGNRVRDMVATCHPGWSLTGYAPQGDLDRPILIHVCKDGTISYRTRQQPIFNGRALAVFSVDTEEQAKEVQVLFGRRQYTPHPEIPGKPWYRWTDFNGTLDDLDRVRDMIRNLYWDRRPK